MAIADKVITLQASQAAVRKIEIMQDGKGNYAVAVYGETKTTVGDSVGLQPGTEIVPIGTAVLDAIWAHALPVLRKGNGLES